jgi:phage-related baseplate assembly protein
MPSLLSLLVAETEAAIYARAISVATSLGLPTTAWSAVNPTRSLYWFLTKVFSALEPMVANFVASGFLDYATGDWLTILASDRYQVDRIGATFAATSVTLTNTGGGLYPIDIGDVVAKYVDGDGNSWTYTNVTGGTLRSGPGTTLALDFQADVAGSASSAPATEISALVTNLIGVTCSNPAASIGTDAELDQALRDRCRAKLALASPNGPTGSYDYVVRSLAGNVITRSRTIADSTTGTPLVYVAGANGAVDGPTLTAAQAAVTAQAPQGFSPTVANSTATNVDVAYTLWLYASVGQTQTQIEAAVQAELDAMFAARPIGGDIVPPATTGALYQSLIASTIAKTFPADTFRVAVTSPAGDTALAINAVAVLNSVTPTIVLVPSP